MIKSTISANTLEEIREKLFQVQSLSKLLKLASSTSYATQIDDEDIAVASDLINTISQDVVNKISENI